jgi:hypothetical protein
MTLNKSIVCLITISLLLLGRGYSQAAGTCDSKCLVEVAGMLASAIAGVQKTCLEYGVQCQLLFVEQLPRTFLQGQVIQYDGITATANVPYFYVVVGQNGSIDPDIYIMNMDNNILNSGMEKGSFDVAVHVPKYTQRVYPKVKVHKGNGAVAIAILAPVGF